RGPAARVHAAGPRHAGAPPRRLRRLRGRRAGRAAGRDPAVARPGGAGQPEGPAGRPGARGAGPPGPRGTRRAGPGTARPPRRGRPGRLPGPSSPPGPPTAAGGGTAPGVRPSGALLLLLDPAVPLAL